MRNQLNKDAALIAQIAKRGIRLKPASPKEDLSDETPHEILLRDLEPSHPSAKVILDL